MYFIKCYVKLGFLIHSKILKLEYIFFLLGAPIKSEQVHKENACQVQFYLAILYGETSNVKSTFAWPMGMIKVDQV